MRWVGDHGYPVPAVHEAEGPAIVMDRVIGPTMFEDAMRHPWRLRRHARTLATLHRRLADVPAPDWLRDTPFEGDGVLHLDLHPLNVLMGGSGPVVIDWANAGRGALAAEVASTWMIAATAVPDTRVQRLAAAVALGPFLRTFLDDVGRDPARPWLRAMGGHRKADRNTKPEEIDRIDRLVSREARS